MLTEKLIYQDSCYNNYLYISLLIDISLISLIPRKIKKEIKIDTAITQVSSKDTKRYIKH